MAMRSWTYTVIFLLYISLFAIPTDIAAQKRRRSYSSSSIYIEPQFFVLKDENIFGHVFMGPNFALGYNQLKQSIYGFSRYEAALAAGAAIGGETMGLNLHFKPLDLGGGWPLVDDDDFSLYLGKNKNSGFSLPIQSLGLLPVLRDLKTPITMTCMPLISSPICTVTCRLALSTC
jgi:hypothetical protein